MKNNSGVTLVALIVIIFLLIIFSSAAIYTSVNSYKLIDLQKYKVQMQAIQSAVDEFYEEYENIYEKNKTELNSTTLSNSSGIIGPINKESFLDYFVQYKLTDELNTIMDFIESLDSTSNIANIKDYETINRETTTFLKEMEWWEDVAPNYGIAIDEPDIQKQYYYLSRADIETILGVSNIDISENFIINFQKRYVFSETLINVEKSDGGNKDIYCLYELNDEEKIIEFKAQNTGGFLDIDIIEKNRYYQTARVKLVGQESTIKQIYYIEPETSTVSTEEATSTEIPTIQEKKEFFEEVTGLETKEVLIKIKTNGTYKFTAEDLFGGTYDGSISIQLHEPPVLENNMIPFIATETKDKGIVYPKQGSDDINDWYDYLQGSQRRYATAIITDSAYSGNEGKEFSINQSDEYIEPGEGNGTHIVKVWIPKLLGSQLLGDGYNSTDFINKSGIWVTAEWDDSTKKWVPATQKESINITVAAQNVQVLNLIINNYDSNNKYYISVNDKDFQKADIALGGGFNRIKINITPGLEANTCGEKFSDMKEVKSVRIYARYPNGSTSPIRTIKLKMNDISNNDSNLIKDGGIEKGDWGTNGWTTSKCSIDTSTVHSGSKSLLLLGGGDGGETYCAYNQIMNYNNNHEYYISFWAYLDSTVTGNLIQIFWNLNINIAEKLKYLPDFSINKTKEWVRNSYTFTSEIDDNTSQLRFDFNNGDPNNSIRYDDICFVDLTSLMTQYSFVQNNKEWCDTFIETENGKTILYYYE